MSFSIEISESILAESSWLAAMINMDLQSRIFNVFTDCHLIHSGRSKLRTQLVSGVATG